MQGYILSAIFFGVCISHLPAGWLANYIGGKILFGAGIGLSGVFSLFTPIGATLGPGILIAIRFLEGLGQGVNYGCITALWVKWAVPNEKSRMNAIVLSGSYIGTFITMALGGVCIILWAAAWFYFVTESPLQHQTITTSELMYIESHLTTPQPKHITIPWKHIFLSRPFWAAVFVHFAQDWSFYIMFTGLPTFLRYVLKYNLKQTGVLSSLPYLFMALTFTGFGYLSDLLTSRFSTTVIRKISIATGLCLQAIALIIIILINNRDAIVVMIIFSVSCGGLAWSGFGINYLDIGAHYAPVLIGLATTITTIADFCAPIVTGYLDKDHTKKEWNIIFSIPCVLLVVSSILYLIFGSVQPWAISTGDDQSILDSTSPLDTTRLSTTSREKLDELNDKLREQLNDSEVPTESLQSVEKHRDLD
ncbi:unnamed protein product [Didymodactylos carnosus]|uniref:Major facilitator superfamily (MFS) profile domain-containing protein n=1 Tax=Didymodactylos carnosus TaxID=1234261 RepID=A0A815DCL4_9BILA|nr:unnamed protein product [Didymodactylos carnosus]CAF1296113.1 unnamed protein product [Didymodactylos carnosus]CAF3899839.1 unnamed protein product [Didymodactylos carnosus]CAF4111029.1 unnamed protein product [Didymodactylos carnosus]